MRKNRNTISLLLAALMSISAFADGGMTVMGTETEVPVVMTEAPAPETAAPETATPETQPPETSASETAPQEAQTPAQEETPAQETTAPETAAPETAPQEAQAPAQEETPAQETAAPETQPRETQTPETAAPETSENTVSQTEIQEKTPEQMIGEETEDRHTLAADNTRQIEEEKKNGKPAAPYISISITAKDEFADSRYAYAEVLSDDASNALVPGIDGFLSDLDMQTDSVYYPLYMAVLDENGNEQKDMGDLYVKVSMTDTDLLKDMLLFHEDTKDKWENIQFSITDEKYLEDGELPYVTFSVKDDLGPFLFASVKEKETVAPETQVETEIRTEETAENQTEQQTGAETETVETEVQMEIAETEAPESETQTEDIIPELGSVVSLGKMEIGTDAEEIDASEKLKETGYPENVSFTMIDNGVQFGTPGEYHVTYRAEDGEKGRFWYLDLTVIVKGSEMETRTEADTENQTKSQTEEKTDTEASTEKETDDIPEDISEEIKEVSIKVESDGLPVTAEGTGAELGEDILSVKRMEDGDLADLNDSLTEYLNGEHRVLEEVVLPLDMTLTKDGNRTEPKDPVNVSIDTGRTDMEDVSLYHRNISREWEKIEMQADENGLVTFTTDSFSPFLFIRTSADLKAEIRKGPRKASQVESTQINEFTVRFYDGAKKTTVTAADGSESSKWVWNPTDPASGHLFIYRLDYNVSGTFSNGQKAVTITLPLHILKDRGGNWADTFDCPYLREDEFSEGEEPDFVYSIDETANTATIYNYKPITAARAGFIEFSYETTKTEMDYVDMRDSTKVPAHMTSTGSDEVVKTADAEADPVTIDTHATIAYTTKKWPTLYKTWNSSWNADLKPKNASGGDDSANWYYLVWPIQTYINKNTQPYTFKLEDVFDNTKITGQAIGYSFGRSSNFTASNETGTDSPLRDYGYRYDYVLTKHSKAEADKFVKDNGRYDVLNNITAIVTPIDRVDPPTEARSQRPWWYEAPVYIAPTGAFWQEKWGIFNYDWKVEDSEDISDYTLTEFRDKEEDSIPGLKWFTYGEMYPYPWTLGNSPQDGSAPDGTVDDALKGRYGQKPVTFTLSDDTFYVEGTDEEHKLTNDDYDLTAFEWIPTVNDATFDEDRLTYYKSQVKTYKDKDVITIYARVGDTWKKAGDYRLKDKTYINIDKSIITGTKAATLRYYRWATDSQYGWTSGQGSIVTLGENVKGLRLEASNAYYYTRLNLFPVMTLKRTDHVISLAGDNASTEKKIHVTNEATGTATQGSTTLFDRTTQGTDYVQAVIKTSEIKKDVTATRNDKRSKVFLVTWRAKAEETYIDNDGKHYVLQNGGTFYDLAPAGASIDRSSVTAYANGAKLSQSAYSVSVTENYRDSGKDLLTVQIADATKTNYIIEYRTSHSYNSIADYGKILLNSVSYETRNDKLADSFPDNGGNITEKENMKDLDPDTDGPKFIYAEARYHININTAASTGLIKQVKEERDRDYSYKTVTSPNGTYSYRLRLANDASSASKDVILYDSLENFYQKAEEASPTIPSDWHGTLTGIDVGNLRNKGIAPVIYLSSTPSLNLNSHHDITDRTVWTEQSEFLKSHKLSDAAAIAVDAGKKTDGTAFTLEKGDSMSFRIFMKAPATDPSNTEGHVAVAYNNVYCSRTVEKDGVSADQFYHQDYTQIQYRVAGDFEFKKVSSKNADQAVSGAEFVLKGTSAYGTVYNEKQVSGTNGGFSFENIERGTYQLVETSCTDDWLLNTKTWTLTIGADGSASVAEA